MRKRKGWMLRLLPPNPPDLHLDPVQPVDQVPVLLIRPLLGLMTAPASIPLLHIVPIFKFHKPRLLHVSIIYPLRVYCNHYFSHLQKKKTACPAFGRTSRICYPHFSNSDKIGNLSLLYCLVSKDSEGCRGASQRRRAVRLHDNLRPPCSLNIPFFRT